MFLHPPAGFQGNVGTVVEDLRHRGNRLDVLLPGAVLANPIDLLTSSAARSDDLLVFDAATVDDLARIAEVLDRLGPHGRRGRLGRAAW